VFGRNTLIIYLLSETAEKILHMIHIDQQPLFEWLYATAVAPWAGDKLGSLLLSLAYMLCLWAVAYAMDRKRIYVRL